MNLASTVLVSGDAWWLLSDVSCDDASVASGSSDPVGADESSDGASSVGSRMEGFTTAPESRTLGKEQVGDNTQK